MKKRERGAIIVEASIALPFFIFAIVTILFIVNMCYAQTKIGVALNTTAKEISEYSYLYGLTGLNQKQKELYDGGAQARGSIDEIVDGVGTMFSSASEIGNTAKDTYNDPSSYSGAVESIKGSLEQGRGGFTKVQEEIEGIAEDPKAFILSAAKMIGNEAIDEAKSKLIAAPLARSFCKKHLVRSAGDDTEAFLKFLGIVPKGGSYYKGIDFGDSVIFLNGSDEIRIIAKYQIQVIKLLGIDFKLTFTQCGATKAWFSGVSEISPDTKSSGDEDGGESGEEKNNDEPTTTEDGLTVEDYAKIATHNDAGQEVVLGKYSDSEAGQSYIESADQFDATYFDLDNYDELYAKYGEDFVWKINEAFLADQEAKGKTFLLTDNPDTATGSYAKEVRWLKNQGYHFEYNPGVGVWKAVK